MFDSLKWTGCSGFVSQCRHRLQFVSERLRASVRHRSDSVVLRHRRGGSDLCRPAWICRHRCFELLHQLQQHEAQQQQHGVPERTAAEAADGCCDLKPGQWQSGSTLLCPCYTDTHENSSCYDTKGTAVWWRVTSTQIKRRCSLC